MTRICCISDTHGKHYQLKTPECDILLFAGDMSDVGDRWQIEDFLSWFTDQPASHKVYIAGNHDMTYEDNQFFKQEMIDKFNKIHYLEDGFVTLEGLKIYGSPWQPDFCSWSFNLPRGNALMAKWKLIPDDINVLITHGPPWQILDDVGYEHVGCWDLANRVKQLKDLKLMCFGHIHPSHGQCKIGNTIFVNASLCDDCNQIINEPIIIDI